MQDLSQQLVRSHTFFGGSIMTTTAVHRLVSTNFMSYHHQSNLLSIVAVSFTYLHLFNSRQNSVHTMPTQSTQGKMYDHVCLGGTFDGIHAGHKLMLGEASSKCRKKLVVGVTDRNMTKSKILWELIKPLDERLHLVREYLNKIAPNIEHDVVPISDMFGPTITRPELQYLVVSEETLKGGHKVNEERQRKQWSPLEIGVVKLLDQHSSLEEDQIDPDILTVLGESKVSSSALRVARLGSVIRAPKPNKNISDRPYLIGLTGGIASGKSSISEYLQMLGIGYINNDALTHRSYGQPDLPVYKKIVETFGSDQVLTDDGSQRIDRAKLGQIVFNDRAKLELLQSWIWPAVSELTRQEIERLAPDHEIIVIESPMLVEAKLNERVHQVWVSMVPQAEAIRRLKETRGLSQEAAEARLSNQMDNEARIKFANVVFCTLWNVEFTCKQVRKALDQLRADYLQSHR